MQSAFDSFEASDTNFEMMAGQMPPQQAIFIPSQLRMTPVSEEPLARNDLAGDFDMMADTTMTSDAVPSHLMEATTAIDSEASLPPLGNATEAPVFMT